MQFPRSALSRYGVVVASLLLVACSGRGTDDRTGGKDAGDVTGYDVTDDEDLYTYDEDTSSDAGDAEDTTSPRDPNCHPADVPKLTTEPFAGGHEFSGLVHMTQAPGDSSTYYVVERKGRIKIVRDGNVLSEPFLDISDQVVSSYGEQGLLGLAFHPDYEENGRFFIAYTSSGDKRNVVAEYERSSQNPDRANPEEVQRLVNISDPKKQHNGGTLTFGPEGYLYASLGNGGAKQKRKHDGIGRAQYLGSVFGTIMRMDVDRPDSNFAAPDNPFVDDADADDRIYAYGLRNPWRFTIHPRTGDLYIGDVGKQSWEEVDFVGADSGGGQNFGWPAYLGPDDGPVETAKKAVDEHTKPIFAYEYSSDSALIPGGCAIIGGDIYRGDAISELRDYYLFGDLCSKTVAALRYCDTADDDAEPELVDKTRLEGLKTPFSLRAIVEDNQRRLYLVGAKKITRVVPAN